MQGLKSGVYYFKEDGWVLDFFVQPREDFDELAGAIVAWCEERGIELREPVPDWIGRKELVANVTVDEAMEFKLRWC